MERIEITDSNYIKVIGYDTEDKQMVITFNNGKTFNYNKVEPELWEQFKAAESKGKFFHANIKGAFEGNEIIEPPKFEWWGYKHTSGTLQAKRYFDKRDIQEAHESDFCDIVVGPFMAANRDEALEIVKQQTA